MAEIRRTRGVPARRGMPITVDGKHGRITGSRYGYIMVLFEGWKRSRPCHPTWRVDYAPPRREVVETPNSQPENRHG